MFIPEEIVERVREASDIVEVISGYVPLKKAGKNFKARCPFHQEKTPSFTVSPERQMYHCFGCGAGGNVFSFLMAHQRLDFPEAVKFLAGRAGIALPRQGKAAETSSYALLYRANELATQYYQNNLKSPQASNVRDYLKKRGLTTRAIEEFKIGWAQPGWDGLAKALSAKGLKPENLIKAGLALSRASGGCYDRFRGRIIFPICDTGNKVIGFGARVLGEELPKYVNSPQTDVFDKGKNLFGLDKAKDSIRREQEAIIVEGYTDMIALFQEEIKNAVASLGTSLTSFQLRRLARYAPALVMIYDSDAAGEAASLRGLDLAIEEGLEVRIVNLPEGFDPDSFLHRFGPEELKAKVREAQSLFDYKCELLLSKYDAGSPEGKARITKEMLPTLSRIKDAVLKAGYIKKLSETLSLSEASLLAELARAEKAPLKYYDEKTSPEAEKPNPLEAEFLRLMLEDNELTLKVKEALTLEDFSDSRLRKIAQVLFELAEANKPLNANLVLLQLGDKETGRIVSQLMLESQITPDKERWFRGNIKRIKERRLPKIRAEIEEADSKGEEERYQKLAKRQQKLSRELKP